MNEQPSACPLLFSRSHMRSFPLGWCNGWKVTPWSIDVTPYINQVRDVLGSGHFLTRHEDWGNHPLTRSPFNHHIRNFWATTRSSIAPTPTMKRPGSGLSQTRRAGRSGSLRASCLPCRTQTVARLLRATHAYRVMKIKVLS